MNEHLKDYFYFTRSEKNGILVLLIILLLLLIFPYLYNLLPFAENNAHQQFNKEISLFASSLKESVEPEYQNRLDQYIIERYDSIELQFFNPNNESKESLLKLGLTEKQANTIINYRNKGGQFNIKDDFRKIYGIRDQQYQILKPFILLPDYGNNESKYQKAEHNFSKESIPVSYFQFDPNTASNEDFLKLGLSEANIKTIRNYQNKVGKFKSKEDFKKIYGITEEKQNQLEPYVFINKELEKPEAEILIELNEAGIDDLLKLKGLGKVSAEAILSYRQKLGGFANIEQVLEIKLITPGNFDLFKSRLTVDKNKIKTISLNFAEADELAAHPYLNYTQAKEIIKFRSINGPFQHKKQLLDNKLLLDNNFRKIEPYLSVN